MPIPGGLVQSGPEIEPIMEWQRLMSRMSGNEERQNGLKLLLEGVKSWRSESAQELSMAPASVMPQHIMYKVCIHAARYGLDSVDSLSELGVRISTADRLAEVLKSWRSEHAPSPSELSEGDRSDH